MNIDSLTTFFMWCTVINGSLLTLWGFIFMVMPDTVYALQTKWFPLPQEQYTVVIYSFLGLFKLIFIVFNLTPYLALLIMG